jgi:Septum formation
VTMPGYPAYPGPAYPYPGTWGAQPPAYPPAKAWDGFSIAALVTALVLLWPVAFVLAIVGIARTGPRSRLQGRWLAVAALLISILEGILTGLLVVVGVIVAHSDIANTAADLARGDRILTSGVDRGDCFVAPETLTFDILSSVKKQDCVTTHEVEGIARTSEYADGPYPGESHLRRLAMPTCSGALLDIRQRHREEHSLIVITLVPTRRAWEWGDATVICAVLDPAGPRKGSLTDFPRGLSGTNA